MKRAFFVLAAFSSVLASATAALAQDEEVDPSPPPTANATRSTPLRPPSETSPAPAAERKDEDKKRLPGALPLRSRARRRASSSRRARARSKGWARASRSASAYRSTPGLPPTTKAHAILGGTIHDAGVGEQRDAHRRRRSTASCSTWPPFPFSTSAPAHRSTSSGSKGFSLAKAARTRLDHPGVRGRWSRRDRHRRSRRRSPRRLRDRGQRAPDLLQRNRDDDLLSRHRRRDVLEPLTAKGRRAARSRSAPEPHGMSTKKTNTISTNIRQGS